MFSKSPNQTTTAVLSIGALVLIALASSLNVTAQPRTQSYGLGMPRTSGTGGATRGNLPQVIMLVPDDGAKTLSANPTFYWFVPEGPFTTTFFLRDSNQNGAKTIYRVQGTAQKSGLYRITLPQNISLMAGKPQRWQVRWQDNKGGQVDIASGVLLESNPTVSKAITTAKNDLEKARIYAANLYWYDALDSYTKWLDANPKDKIALKERNDLLKAGFQGSSSVTADLMDKFLTRLNQESARQLALQLENQAQR
jgi:hypothetical protein